MKRILVGIFTVCAGILPTGVQAEETGCYPVTATFLPFAVTQMSAEVSGRVLEVCVDIGAWVEKGAVLVKLDPRFLELELKKQRVQVELAQAEYERSAVDYERKKSLWSGTEQSASCISLKHYEDAEFTLKQHRLLYELANAELERIALKLDETSIRAPYAGVITKQFIEKGQSVAATPLMPLVEIMDISHVLLEFSLSQQLTGRVHLGSEVILPTGIRGKVQTIFPQIDPSNHCFKCRAVLENQGEMLKPGAFVSARLSLDAPI